MRLRVDHAADAVYLNLTDRPVKDSEKVADSIVVDYDDEGRVIGIEILDTSKRTADPAALKQFAFEEVTPSRFYLTTQRALQLWRATSTQRCLT